MTAKYLDGKPTNLEAAAADALDWLELFRNGYSMAGANDDNRQRLDNAIAALKKFTPADAPVFKRTAK